MSAPRSVRCGDNLGYRYRTHGVDDAAEPLEDKDWRQLILDGVAADGLHTHAHEVLTLRLSAYTTTQHILSVL